MPCSPHDGETTRWEEMFDQAMVILDQVGIILLSLKHLEISCHNVQESIWKQLFLFYRKGSGVSQVVPLEGNSTRIPVVP